jgi:hypothetical protein
MAVLPANPKVIGSEPYHGNSDGASAGPRAGMDEWIRQAIKYGNGAFWNNGSWGIRQQHGHDDQLSVHATGRAVDLSYRPSEKHPNANRKATIAFINIVLANANALGVECVLDYFPKAFGRGWRCERQRWTSYSKPTIFGSPGGDWLHVEINPQMADAPNQVKQAFQRVFTELPQ